MITEFQIEGFKSFGTPPQKLNLSSLNVLVGANASGKSNFLKALQFVQNAVLQNVDYAVNELGGVGEVRHKGMRQSKTPKPLWFKLKMDDARLFSTPEDHKYEVNSLEYEVRIDLRNKDSKPIIESEILTAKMVSGEDVHEFSLKRGTKSIVISDPITKTVPSGEMEIPEQEANRLALGVGFYTPPLVFLKAAIQNWQFYNFSPSIAREPSKDVPDIRLGSSGQNLAAILHEIEKDEGLLEALNQSIKGIVPGFKEVKTDRLPYDKKLAFQVFEENIVGAINPSSVSDGTIRLLALLVALLRTGEGSSLVAIEEPENGLHPHLSEHIMELIKDASERGVQVIITTHNPDFLDYLEPSQVLLVDKENGFTKIKPASSVDDIGTFRKHFSLGELWTQGTLGGNI